VEVSFQIYAEIAPQRTCVAALIFFALLKICVLYSNACKLCSMYLFPFGFKFVDYCFLVSKLV
jgi:hypothetical protein